MNQIQTQGNEKDNAELLQYLSEMQLKESQFTFQECTNTCFTQCIKTFTSFALNHNEKECMNQCARRYLEFYTRVGLRYAEENAIKQQQAQNHTS